MIRLLTTGLSNTASGTRSMMMNWYRYMDRDKIQYDFLVRPDFNQPELEKEIRTLGGNIYIESNTPTEKSQLLLNVICIIFLIGILKLMACI